MHLCRGAKERAAAGAMQQLLRAAAAGSPALRLRLRLAIAPTRGAAATAAAVAVAREELQEVGRRALRQERALEEAAEQVALLDDMITSLAQGQEQGRGEGESAREGERAREQRMEMALSVMALLADVSDNIARGQRMVAEHRAQFKRKRSQHRTPPARGNRPQQHQELPQNKFSRPEQTQNGDRPPGRTVARLLPLTASKTKQALCRLLAPLDARHVLPQLRAPLAEMHLQHGEAVNALLLMDEMDPWTERLEGDDYHQTGGRSTDSPGRRQRHRIPVRVADALGHWYARTVASNSGKIEHALDEHDHLARVHDLLDTAEQLFPNSSMSFIAARLHHAASARQIARLLPRWRDPDTLRDAFFLGAVDNATSGVPAKGGILQQLLRAGAPAALLAELMSAAGVASAPMPQLLHALVAESRFGMAIVTAQAFNVAKSPRGAREQRMPPWLLRDLLNYVRNETEEEGHDGEHRQQDTRNVVPPNAQTAVQSSALGALRKRRSSIAMDMHRVLGSHEDALFPQYHRRRSGQAPMITKVDPQADADPFKQDQWCHAIAVSGALHGSRLLTHWTMQALMPPPDYIGGEDHSDAASTSTPDDPAAMLELLQHFADTTQPRGAGSSPPLITQPLPPLTHWVTAHPSPAKLRSVVGRQPSHKKRQQTRRQRRREQGERE